jgi:hypothetical protein
MRLRQHAALVLAVFAFAALPAAALGDGVNYEGPDYHPVPPEHPKPPHETAPKGHAYGFYCKGASKKHVKGVKGTPFSACVHAAKQADHHPGMSAKKACKALSKKHVKGTKGTPFSICVKGVKKMRAEEAASVARAARA